eukprot:g14602.t1
MVETTLHNDPEYIQFAHKEPHPTLLKHVRRFWPLRSSARRMIPLLANSKQVNPLGFATTQERRKGTLLDFICSEKERFPDKVLLVRVGEFYEAFGFDAILLVEHCGLNPMGSKARAGFPLKNIQQTLDGLTDVGLSVAVYEEDGKDAVMPQSTSGRKRSQSKAIKTRFLSQIISPGSSTYIYNSALRTDDIEYREGASYIGIQISGGGGSVASSVSNTKSGSRADGSLHYTLFEVQLDSRLVRIHERLTEDAARCIIEASSRNKNVGNDYRGLANQYSSPNVDVEGNQYTDAHDNSGGSGMFYVARTGGGEIPARTKRVLFSNTSSIGIHGGGMRSTQGSSITRLRRAEKDPHAFLEEFLAHLARDMENENVADLESFRVVGSSDLFSVGGFGIVGKQPRPLYAPTAQQLGILPSAQVPDLVSYLLPANDAPSSARDYLRRWLLRPPPYEIADQMQLLLKGLLCMNQGLPPLRTVVSTGKMVNLVYSKQANANLFRDVAELLESVLLLLGSTDEDTTRLLTPLANIVSYECGFRVDPKQLQDNTKAALEVIDNTINRESFVTEAEWTPTIENDSNANLLHDYTSLRAMFVKGDENDGISCRQGRHGFFLDDMFRKNEYDFRSAVLSTASDSLEGYFTAVDCARAELTASVLMEIILPLQNQYKQSGKNAIENSLPPFLSSKNELKYDVLNNKIMFYKKPPTIDKKESTNDSSFESPIEWVHPIDRHGRKMPSRFTTKSLELATAKYLGACEDARAAARRELRNLSGRFVDEQHLSTAIASIQFNETLLAANLHAREASRKLWKIPELECIPRCPTQEQKDLIDENWPKVRLTLPNLVPYWLSAQDGAVKNNVDLQGQWLLTGSNMSGKSTLLRSVTAAALLANCGLAVPIWPCQSESRSDNAVDECADNVPIPRLDGFFLRTNGADCPSEGLSAFALEADDMRILLRDLTPRSIAAVDELGRGTSPQEGAAIVGAMLEEFDRRGCVSIFATHLHSELSQLMNSSSLEQHRNQIPLQLVNTRFKTMEVIEDTQRKKVRWTYKLVDGISKNARSIATARAHRVPEYILQRANDLHKTENYYADIMSSSVMNEMVCVESKETPLTNAPISMDSVMNVLQDTSYYIENQDYIESTIILDHGWEPPPRLAENVPCVYVLLLEPLGHLYVGETRSLSQRIKQHTNRFGDEISKIGVFPLKDSKGESTQESVTNAKYLETCFINFLQREGFHLVNVRQE